MKLGVSYNLFDGEELLEGSIKQIKDEVDYISVVYQTKSNLGNKCSDNLINLIEKLKSDKLIDELYLYEPENISPSQNELKKRQIGLELSKKNGCTYHMSIDTDEYYEKGKISFLKKLIEEKDYDSSYCQMLSYYKSWEYVLDPPEDYYVPLIYKIEKDKNFVLSAPSPVLVDPTRRILGIKNPLILKRDEMQMHHGSYIRNDIKKKLLNSSALVNYLKDVESITKHYENWKYPNLVIWGGKPIKFLKVRKVENIFN